MSLDEDTEILTRIPLFALFEPGALRALALSSDAQALRAGDLLFRRGEESDGGYILASGSVALTAHDDGRPPLHVLRPWALIGEMALVAPSWRPITAQAREPTTVLKISRKLFHHILEQHPLTAARLREFFRERLVDFARNAQTGLVENGKLEA
jgi:CRP-like cAMP-binding protein